MRIWHLARRGPFLVVSELGCSRRWLTFFGWTKQATSEKTWVKAYIFWALSKAHAYFQLDGFIQNMFTANLQLEEQLWKPCFVKLKVNLPCPGCLESYKSLQSLYLYNYYWFNLHYTGSQTAPFKLKRSKVQPLLCNLFTCIRSWGSIWLHVYIIAKL